MRRKASRPARSSDVRRRCQVERPDMRRQVTLCYLAALFVLAGCGGNSGSATLKVTRDRGQHVLLVARIPAGLTAMQALERKAKVTTSYGGRFVVALNGLASAPHPDWVHVVHGVEA